jgi:hypothetical protein
MLKSNAAMAGLALFLLVGFSGVAIAQENGAAENPCTSNRTYVQDDPNRRDWDVSVDGDEDDTSWMTQQQVARIVLYDPADFRGRRVGITRDTPDLGERNFADIASSIRVYGGTWELCEEANYGGTCRCFSSHTNVNRFGLGNPVTDTDLEAEGFADRVSSIRLVRRPPRS